MSKTEAINGKYGTSYHTETKRANELDLLDIGRRIQVTYSSTQYSTDVDAYGTLRGFVNVGEELYISFDGDARASLIPGDAVVKLLV